MKLTLLWEHHCFDGITEEIFKYGFYKFNLNVTKKRNFFEAFFNKLQKKITEKIFILNLPQEHFNILYNLFNRTNDFFTEFIVICPEENLQHFGYLHIKKNKEIVFVPVNKATNEEVIKRDRNSNIINKIFLM